MEQNNGMVSISFNFSNINVKNINVNSNEPFDPNEISKESIGNSTSFKYAGRHDHGDLPQLKSNDDNSKLISALLEAKQECDTFLTSKIDIMNDFANKKDNEMDEDNLEEDEISLPLDKKIKTTK